MHTIASYTYVLRGLLATLILISAHPPIQAQNDADRATHTTEETLATIGYLAQQNKTKTSCHGIEEDFRLFIKKISLIARLHPEEQYPSIKQLDTRLRSSIQDIEMKLMLKALSEAAYLIKNRTENFCSAAEISRLNSALHRWCTWAIDLINQCDNHAD